MFADIGEKAAAFEAFRTSSMAAESPRTEIAALTFFPTEASSSDRFSGATDKVTEIVGVSSSAVSLGVSAMAIFSQNNDCELYCTVI